MLLSVWCGSTITNMFQIAVHKSADFWSLDISGPRRTAGKTRWDRTRNERIREELNQKKTLTDIIEEQQLKWSGHVYRMPDERKPKQAMEMRREGRIGR